MNLRKNAQAKIGVAVASLVALLIGWGLVHQNPPPATASDGPVAVPTSTAPAGSRSRTTPPSSAPAAPARTKRTTRTHAS